jgi:hypothetical protein
MIEAAAAEMLETGWAGIEVRAFNGSFHRKDPDGRIWYEAPRPIKEWTVTFFYIIKSGLTTVKVVGKGKTLAEAITQAKGAAYAYNSRYREEIHLSPPQGGPAG